MCVCEITNCIKCYEKKQIVPLLWYCLIWHRLFVEGDFPECLLQEDRGLPLLLCSPKPGHLVPTCLPSLSSIWSDRHFRKIVLEEKGKRARLDVLAGGPDGTMLVCTGDSAGTERHGRTQVRKGRSVNLGMGRTWWTGDRQQSFPEFLVCVGIWVQCPRWTRTSLGGKIIILWLSFVGHDLPLLPASRWPLPCKTWFKTWLLTKQITWLLQEASPD